MAGSIEIVAISHVAMCDGSEGEDAFGEVEARGGDGCRLRLDIEHQWELSSC